MGHPFTSDDDDDVRTQVLYSSHPNHFFFVVEDIRHLSQIVNGYHTTQKKNQRMKKKKIKIAFISIFNIYIK